MGGSVNCNCKKVFEFYFEEKCSEEHLEQMVVASQEQNLLGKLEANVIRAPRAKPPWDQSS